MAGDARACVAIRARRGERGLGLGGPRPTGVSSAWPALVRRGRPASPALPQGPRTAVGPWLPGLAASRAALSFGWRCPGAWAFAPVLGRRVPRATLIREDCLTPFRRSCAFPLVPPYLSSPPVGWMDRPGGAAGLAGGRCDRAVDSPQSPWLRTALRLRDRRLLRLSRVPGLSLYPHDLVDAPGGLPPVLPLATGRLRRSSGLRLAAVLPPRHPAS